MRDGNELNRPCYVISDKGVSYEDDWCYGKSEYLGRAGAEHYESTDIIKAHIRKAFDERNGLPLYRISDHGNICRVRCIKLRKAKLAEGKRLICGN